MMCQLWSRRFSVRVSFEDRSVFCNSAIGTMQANHSLLLLCRHGVAVNVHCPTSDSVIIAMVNLELGAFMMDK